MENKNHSRKPDRVNRTVGIGVEVGDNFQYSCATKAFERLRCNMLLTTRDRSLFSQLLPLRTGLG